MGNRSGEIDSELSMQENERLAGEEEGAAETRRIALRYIGGLPCYTKRDIGITFNPFPRLVRKTSVDNVSLLARPPLDRKSLRRMGVGLANNQSLTRRRPRRSS